ncbi:hypothetical protein GPECTOR_5g143 [Gonium pectorale]|uniref:Uncharacterized protein n=1 Tax=Gonium pectorale TaxID=33097 RepID=A0A150GW54_GONPE|nr:hypothetical protein GPECTOR_5g143 [Gonium pectorale]|eukprot:KXZ54034.1 hypothetical protein GPECTOR_5g143 [Gonium pectorale]
MAAAALAANAGFLAAHGERLHRALEAEASAIAVPPPRGAWQEEQPHGDAAEPPRCGGDGEDEAEWGEEEVEEEGEGEEQRLPAYVLRRYAVVAGLREKTLARVARALAAEGARLRLSAVWGHKVGRNGRSAQPKPDASPVPAPDLRPPAARPSAAAAAAAVAAVPRLDLPERPPPSPRTSETAPQQRQWQWQQQQQEEKRRRRVSVQSSGSARGLAPGVPAQAAAAAAAAASPLRQSSASSSGSSAASAAAAAAAVSPWDSSRRRLSFADEGLAAPLSPRQPPPAGTGSTPAQSRSSTTDGTAVTAEAARRRTNVLASQVTISSLISGVQSGRLTPEEARLLAALASQQRRQQASAAPSSVASAVASALASPRDNDDQAAAARPRPPQLAAAMAAGSASVRSSAAWAASPLPSPSSAASWDGPWVGTGLTPPDLTRLASSISAPGNQGQGVGTAVAARIGGPRSGGGSVDGVAGGSSGDGREGGWAQRVTERLSQQGAST